MSDAIFFKGLALHAHHGVMQHEAKVGQTFHIDLAIELELGTASRTDKLKDTVSYDLVIMTVTEAFCGRRYRLVEAAAGAVADAVLARCPQVLWASQVVSNSIFKHASNQCFEDRSGARSSVSP
jgi:dihydroneopterin aldolase